MKNIRSLSGKILTLLTALALCLGTASCGKKEQAELPEIYVESEFAQLRTVIVSRSELTDSVLPVSQSYVKPEELDPERTEIKDGLIYMHPDTAVIERMEKERLELIKVLEKYGVEVLRPRKLTQAELDLATDPDGPTHGNGLSNFFVRDPFIVVGDRVIEANFRKEYRRYEALTARDIFLGRCSYVSLPGYDIADSEAGPFLEGGDVIVYHKQVFVGNSGYGSNSAGIEWLRDYLEPFGYEVTEVRLKGLILHLDCALGLVREGLMIVCEDSFADGIPEAFRDWDRITVPESDARRLAVNGLPVNEEVYITDIAFADTIGRQLEQRGIKVEYLDLSATRRFAGSAHCSTLGVLRID